MLTGFGVVVTVAAFGWAAYRAIPESSQDPARLVGSAVTLAQLSTVNPRPAALSIVGPSMCGKTTLRHRLTLTHAPPIRTQTISAQIIALQTAPPVQFALLDGGGEKFAQQFELAAQCDFLCLLVDHNASDTDSSVDPNRLKQNAEFLQQIRHFLDENRVAPKKSIRILLNKRDLWGTANASDQALLQAFQTSELQNWKQGNRGHEITIGGHSNSDPSDIAAFAQYLKSCVEASGRPNA